MNLAENLSSQIASAVTCPVVFIGQNIDVLDLYATVSYNVTDRYNSRYFLDHKSMQTTENGSCEVNIIGFNFLEVEQQANLLAKGIQYPQYHPNNLKLTYNALKNTIFTEYQGQTEHRIIITMPFVHIHTELIEIDKITSGTFIVKTA